MKLTLQSAISKFGAETKAKLSNPAATGEPEDQLRAPLEGLVSDLAQLCHYRRDSVTTIGETSLSDLKTRPDYAVTVRNALLGFIEIKAPGKGANPQRFRDPHDKAQWRKLQSLPNLIYTDGNQFSLWRSGELAESIVRLDGDVYTSGSNLGSPDGLLLLFENFLRWEPTPPRDAKQLAQTTARLCRLLREEVVEQLAAGNKALTDLATDWRHLLFPEASDEQFADGYAQAVTFGLLVARGQGIELSQGLDRVAKHLGKTNSLIGAALGILTDDVENQTTLKTSMTTLVRVLDVVDWKKLSRGQPDAWLYFCEDFLAVYDNDLRKKTGSYYTPPEVVDTMIRLVNDALRSPRRFDLPSGLASPTVTLADPAVGTGTFLLGALRSIAQTISNAEGDGAIGPAINAALRRLVAFEIQLGPFAVAQLRLLAEVTELTGGGVTSPLRMFVTDTLGDPYVEQEWLPSTYKRIAESRRQANEIKKRERITVVIGNPPYKEKAKGLGAWVAAGGERAEGILSAWMPPAEWGVGAHAKHIHNLYIYFWRWATWKVFDEDEKWKEGDQHANTGIVCFITVAGFLNGPGFQRMRDYLRRKCDEIWVIDCSPEGHQPEVNTRVFQGVQQPVCIVLASRPEHTDSERPAAVRFRALPSGRRETKFGALSEISLDGDGWVECPTGWRTGFLPASTGMWSTFPALEDFFVYNGSGVMPGRTWVIAPDKQSLQRRWKRLIEASGEEQENLFHPHLPKGKLGDRHSTRRVAKGLSGHEAREDSVAEDTGSCVAPTCYACRSFDRQWIIPDNRLLNRPNPQLWEWYSERQVFLTAPSDRSPTNGPALTFSSAIPDLHHYHGRGGRVFPLWHDQKGTDPNVRPALLKHLSKHYGRIVTAENVMAYIAAVAANPAFTARFQDDLVRPGLRIPLTADADTYFAAVELGCEVIWLHTFGERFSSPEEGRPSQPPKRSGAEYTTGSLRGCDSRCP